MRIGAIWHFLRGVVLLVGVLAGLGCTAFAQAPPLDEQAVIRGVDAAVKARFDATLSYTVT